MNLNRLLSCFVGLLVIKVSLAQVPAFPGAEGFGKYTTGGRGGEIVLVTNLEDEGEGSFRKAVAKSYPRIVVFTVSGTIRLKTPLNIKGDITIAGQTAPGDGICIADQPVKVNGDNVIIQYMRFRMGDRYQSQKGQVDGSGHDDAFGANRKKNIIIDHCSFSWSTDEVFSIYDVDSTTVQWCMISEPLNYSYHFEKGDKDFERHGYGGIWGGASLSAHHNLFAHCVSRMPRFNGTRLGATKEFVDFRNNVIYNWEFNNTYGGEGGRYNIVANYYKAGPVTSKKVARRIVNPSRNEKVGFGEFYVAENCVDGFIAVTKDNTLGIDISGNKDEFSADTIIKTVAFTAPVFAMQKAADAYQSVLRHVGASYNRDTLDMRIIKDVENGTGRIIDVQGGFPHGTPFEQTINAWPALKLVAAPSDTDKDGIPDAWEKNHGLNPADPKDASTQTLQKGYMNIEVYIHSLAK